MVEQWLCNPLIAVRFCTWASCGGASLVGALACEASRSGFKSRSQGYTQKEGREIILWNIKVENKFYARGYNRLTIKLVSNQNYARNFSTKEKAESFASKIFKLQPYEVVEKEI